MIEVKDKLTSKSKDKLQEGMDKLFQELTGRKNFPKYSWTNNVPYKERKYGKSKFSK